MRPLLINLLNAKDEQSNRYQGLNMTHRIWSCLLLYNQGTSLDILRNCKLDRGKGAVLQIGRSLIRFQVVSFEFFIDIKSFRSHYGPGVDSASNRNEYQEHFVWSKGGRRLRLTTLPPSCAVVMKSRNLNLLEPSGPLRAYNRTDLQNCEM